MRIYSVIVALLFLSACGGDTPGGTLSPGGSSSSSSSSGFVPHSPSTCNLSTPENWPCSWTSPDGSYGGCSHGAGCGWSNPSGSSSSSTSSGASTSSSSSSGYSAGTCNLGTPENWPCSWTDSNGSVWGCDWGGCSSPLPGFGSSSSSSSGGAIAECPDGSDLPRSLAYPLGYSSHLGVWATINGGFESILHYEAITWNTEPLYVMSGEASAHLGDEAFRGHLYTESLGVQAVIEEGGFHIYSLSGEAEEYVYDLTEYIPECGTDGVGEKVLEKTFTVPPNTWFAVSIDTPLVANGKDLILTIRRADGEPQEFYLDDVIFSGTR